MAQRDILTAPDPRLKKRARRVETVDDGIRRLMDDMLETMYAAPGIGLAAPQVGESVQVLVIDLGREEEDRDPLCMANPEIIWESDETVSTEEGCLSVPDQYGEVERPARVRVRFLDRENEIREMDVEGLLSTCIQHEMDHLGGRLFVDHLSSIKRNMILRKLQKAKKQKVA